MDPTGVLLSGPEVLLLIRLSSQGTVIHEAFDSMGAIQIVDYRKHRVLRFDSLFEQSKIDLKRPWLPVHEYNRAMMLPVAFAKPAHVTVLGLGGGVMVSGLHHLLPECQLHAVELRREVLEVAREFFSLPQSTRVRVTIADARNALEQMEEGGTDLILADMYGADRMSPAQAQRRFLKQCTRALSPAGWLAINYHRPPDPDGTLFRQLRGQFSVLLKFTSRSNNTVLFASRQPFESLHPRDPLLDSLEAQLPIGWRHLMAKVERLS